jgi:phosphoribosyl-AMP cyclohydrolase
MQFIEGFFVRSSNSSDAIERETGRSFMPKFDSNGLLSAIAVHADTGEILMLAFMNVEALKATQDSGIAHFYSRSRKTLWKKGETSGNLLRIEEILVDCDQDALILRVTPSGPACHTGAVSCFYRRLEGDALVKVIT